MVKCAECGHPPIASLTPALGSRDGVSEKPRQPPLAAHARV